MENNRMLYRMKKSPLCNYMINFIHKLRGLPAKTLMNNVLENFTVLQVWTFSNGFVELKNKVWRLYNWLIVNNPLP